MAFKAARALGLLGPLAIAAVGCGDESAPSPLWDAAVALEAGRPEAAVIDGLAPDSPSVEGDAAAATDALPSDGGMPAPAFSIVVLPDTQFYSWVHPDIFEAQTRWIVEHAAERHIAFVLHEGDIVETAFARDQWQRAAKALHALDGVVPYVLAAGNHDLLTGTMGLTSEAPLMNEFFPVARFMQNPWFKGTFEPDKIQNSYQVLRAGNQEWLVLSLEFGPRDAVLAWADGLLSTYSSLPAILVTHAYMYAYNERYDRGKPGECAGKQCFGPHNYGLPEPINDGEEMWQKLVSKHDNLHFVLSGHMVGNAASRLRSVRASGTHVHEILANYQACAVYNPGDPSSCLDAETLKPTKGGDGYLRIMTFDPDRHTVDVQTYSPYLDMYKTSEANQFRLDH
jgi:hypothetical protein